MKKRAALILVCVALIGAVAHGHTPPEILLYAPEGLWNIPLPEGVQITEESFTPTYTPADQPAGTVPCGYNSVTGFDVLPCNFIFPTASKRWIVSKSGGL